jgi:hypothetical protein
LRSFASDLTCEPSRNANKVGTGGDSKSADHRLAASFSVR